MVFWCFGGVVLLFFCGVFVVVLLWWVFLCRCGGVFEVVCFFFCAGVLVFLWWCGGVFVRGRRPSNYQDVVKKSIDNAGSKKQ